MSFDEKPPIEVLVLNEIIRSLSTTEAWNMGSDSRTAEGRVILSVTGQKSLPSSVVPHPTQVTYAPGPGCEAADVRDRWVFQVLVVWDRTVFWDRYCDEVARVPMEVSTEDAHVVLRLRQASSEYRPHLDPEQGTSLVLTIEATGR